MTATQMLNRISDIINNNDLCADAMVAEIGELIDGQKAKSERARKMKTYRVTWNEIYLCSREIEAESEEEAVRIVQDEEHAGTATPDQKEFGDDDYWEANEIKED